MPTLYIVGTPIGNLEDITLRAIRVLSEVDMIAAEDTRVTRKLLSRHGIKTKLTSYGLHNKTYKIGSLIESLTTKNIALVCDAGMPCINDPGQELVSAALDMNFQVVPIPGPSAVTSAIAVSGIPVDRFVYTGFLPSKSSQRKKLLQQLSKASSVLVLLETPHRLNASLRDMLNALGDREISICRELTKLHEEIFRGRISDAVTHFTHPKGEFTLVIGASSSSTEPINQDTLQKLAVKLHKEGVLSRDAIGQITEATGLTRREAYAFWLKTVSSKDK